MSALPDVARQMDQLVARWVPRILSHVCRDPTSPLYGAFDRDWWHYKIRDFPSIILQQGSYALWLARRLPAFADREAELQTLAAAGCRFWNRRAKRRGAFEEYYPWEEGYPPLAFSTLAVMKLVKAGVAASEQVREGAAIAARQLLDRFEPEAANQQVAGLAALALLNKVFPELLPVGTLDPLSARTLALQDPEGWFAEYGGPDLGYLSVTMDCLWDLYDTTTHSRYLEAATRALEFIARYVSVASSSIGMHNARNTDYIVPYGLCRFLAEGGPHGETAARVLAAVFGNLDSPSHFAHAVDDRYLCHYTGHSFIRACLELAKAVPRLADLPAQPPPLVAEEILESAGHYLRRAPPADEPSLILSLRKGGVFTAVSGGGRASDYGWVVRIGSAQYVNHWWSANWKWKRDGNAFEVSGSLAPHREHASRPLAHLALRALSFCLGRRIIQELKSRLIFKKQDAPYTFARRIVVEPRRILVSDRIEHLPSSAEIVRAPRSSKRHVASADSFHAEDLALIQGAACEQTTNRDGETFTAETVYSFPPAG